METESDGQFAALLAKLNHRGSRRDTDRKRQKINKNVDIADKRVNYSATKFSLLENLLGFLE